MLLSNFITVSHPVDTIAFIWTSTLSKHLDLEYDDCVWTIKIKAV